MTTLAAVSVILLACLCQRTIGFKVKNRGVMNRELREFRVPRAIQLRRYMNESLDPCVDFYEFACGNWPNHHPASENNPITSPTETLREIVNNEVRSLLEESVTRYDGNVGRRVKDFYTSCLDVEGASQSVKQAFGDFIKEHGGMPAVDRRWNEHNFDWLTQVRHLRKKFGMDIIVGMEIKPDYQNQRDGRIYIGEPSTLAPKSLCKRGDFNDSQFIDLQNEVVDNMAYWFDLGEISAKKLAINIFDFESTLCRGMSSGEEELDGTINYPSKTLGALNVEHPQIDFQTFVTDSLGQPVHQPVYMTNQNYYQNLAMIIQTTSKQTVANYIMYRALATMNVPKEEDHQQRTRICVEETMKYFPKVVGDFYRRKKFREEIVKDMELVWTKLKVAFNMDVNSQLWIEENTRRKSNYKLDKMQLVSPTYFKDVLENEYNTLRINKTNLWDNIQNLLAMEQKRKVNKLHDYNGVRSWDADVEATGLKVGYSQRQNLIQVPLGLLQPPVYHRSAPGAYKYGVLGSLMAHELVHGFDELGWRYDEMANVRLWWDYNSTLLYKEQVKCFKDQYVSNVGEEAADVPDFELDETIREIIADHGAVNVSFSAYLIWLEETNDQHILYDETLSDVDYTNTQLFFLAFAQNFCLATYESEPPVGFFPWDVSNRAERFRVNGPLMNMKEFAREFNCPPGSDMNPADKCLIY